MATIQTESSSTATRSSRVQKIWKWYHTLSVLVIVLLIVLIGTAIIPWPLTKSNPGSTLGTWWVIMILLTLFVLIIGHGITGSILGALIDEQNKMSLTRLQLVIWTIVILSAWLTCTLWNILVNKTDPLAIALPVQVWLLLGINTATLVGTPLVLDSKKSKSPNPEEASQQLALKGWSEGFAIPPDTALLPFSARVGAYAAFLKIHLKGLIPANDSFDQADLGDLFRGEEIGNFVQLDVSKIQMFFFTLILVLTYAIAIGTMFANLTPTLGITSFPPLDQSMIVLLGISHAGYLTNQAFPHSTPPISIPPTGLSPTTAAPAAAAPTTAASTDSH